MIHEAMAGFHQISDLLFDSHAKKLYIFKYDPFK